MIYSTICTVALIFLVSRENAWGAGSVISLLSKPEIMSTDTAQGVASL